MLKRFCNFCGKEFEKEAYNQNHCCKVCEEQDKIQFDEYEEMKKYVLVKRCKLCNKEFYTSDKYKDFCSEDCKKQLEETKDMTGDIFQEYTLAVNRGKEKIDKMEFIKLFEKRECYYCGCKLYSGSTVIKSNLTIDHIIPISKGGKNKNNLALACSSCNISKGAKSEKEFREYLNQHPELVKQRIADAEEKAAKVEQYKMVYDMIKEIQNKEKITINGYYAKKNKEPEIFENLF